MNRYIERRLAALESDTTFLRHEDFIRIWSVGADPAEKATWPIDLRGKQSDPRHLEMLEALA